MPNGQPWPRISIVTPSFNQAQYIEETLRSVLLQGYPNLEYIVMDGGSTDGTLEILRHYEPFLSYLYVGPDDGQSDALAKGFERATGEIFAWLNSDDRYQPRSLERVALFFAQHPRIVFGSGDVNYIASDGQFVQRIFAAKPSHLVTANTGRHNWPQQGCFWRRSAYRQVGGVNQNLRFCMDRDLFLKLTAIGTSKRIPGAPLADFRVHDQAKSSTILDVAAQESHALCQHYGTPWLLSNKWLASLLWWLWCRPTNLRFYLNRYFGWEF